MTSDVNKWRDVTQKLRHSSVLLTFTKALGLIMGSRVDTEGDNQNPMS